MRLICATRNLANPGGTETYVLTLASHLERLGHDVHLFAPNQGRMAHLARDSGLRVARTVDELPDECDGVIPNFTDVAYDLTARYPGAPHAYVCHSPYFELQLPPNVGGGGGQVAVALNDRVGALLAGLASAPPVVRLRQPIDIDRFHPRAPLSATPRSLLLFGNYAAGERRAMVEDVCAELGIAVSAAGETGRSTDCPEDAINGSDIVMGYGRCVVEAMACGRAAYVYDRHGGDGWVTPESYAALEADGFAGQAASTVVTRDRLREDLLAYSPEMGTYNRDLAVGHHQAPVHAAAVVEAVRSVATAKVAAPRDAPWQELARMARVLGEHEVRVFGLNRLFSALSSQLDDARSELAGAQADLATAEGRIADMQAVAAAREAQNAERQADAEEQRRRLERAQAEVTRQRGEIEAFRATRRYRAALALAKPLDEFRARRGS